MAKVQVTFQGCNDFIRMNKIQSFKAIRTATSDYLGFVMGIKEAKDLVEDVINGWVHVANLDVLDANKVYGFVTALRQFGFTIAGYETDPANDPFTTVVVDAVRGGKYAYAVALLQAKIKHGGAYGA